MTTEFIDLPKPELGASLAGMETNAAAIVSGGMDSVTLVYDMIDHDMKPHLLSFNYGQRHKKELKFAAIAAKAFGLRHDIIDLSSLTRLISNSALTGGPDKTFSGDLVIDVPEGHYAEDNMSVTVVPNRNMIMLSIAAGVAVNYGYAQIATGVHGGDHFQYPDCRPEFIFTAGRAIKKGNEGFHRFYVDQKLMGGLIEDKLSKGEPIMGDEGIQPIFAPYLNATKADIATRAFELGVPFHLTWSCYKGEEKHCGKCGTCVERLEAIAEAQKRMVQTYPHTHNVWIDNTEYADSEYWKTVTK